ncbi:HXXXD-type acyl-transferase family protein [Euphorbia peplus]|nr:HXXXD-type acyl-transferase family protein [Euphorbia peplus]
MFPPRKSLPSRYTSFMHSKWFGKNLCKTRRFVFDANAVSALRTKGRSESVENPTRVEAISAFIWKYAMKALGSPRSNSVLSHTVNLRNRTEPRMSIHSIGNLIFPASATYNPEMEMEMKQLVGLVKEGLGKINSEYLKNYMCGDEGSEAVLRYLDHEISNVSSMENDPYVFSFSSWTCFGLDEIDFGWGEPVWVGLYGEVTDMSNFTVLKDLGRKNNGSIEAWISLDESIMNFLEHDPDFLAFASLNPTINMEEPNKDA